MAEEKLSQALQGEEKMQLLKLVDAYSELLGVTAAESFISGFRLGARFTLDAFVTGL